MPLTDKQKTIKEDLKKFVNEWRSKNEIHYDGALTQDDLIKFTKGLQEKILSDAPLNGKSGQTLILYTGQSQSTGNELWREMNGFCEANPDFYYITNTDGGAVLWEPDFQDSIQKAIGDRAVATQVLSGKKD